jgi:hypothetical protein
LRSFLDGGCSCSDGLMTTIYAWINIDAIFNLVSGSCISTLFRFFCFVFSFQVQSKERRAYRETCCAYCTSNNDSCNGSCGKSSSGSRWNGSVSIAISSVPCMGDSSQMCGGGWRNNVYTIVKQCEESQVPVAAPVPTVDRSSKFSWTDKGFSSPVKDQ